MLNVRVGPGPELPACRENPIAVEAILPLLEMGVSKEEVLEIIDTALQEVRTPGRLGVVMGQIPCTLVIFANRHTMDGRGPFFLDGERETEVQRRSILDATQGIGTLPSVACLEMKTTAIATFSLSCFFALSPTSCVLSLQMYLSRTRVEGLQCTCHWYTARSQW